jgi:hypothetical protein
MQTAQERVLGLVMQGLSNLGDWEIMPRSWGWEAMESDLSAHGRVPVLDFRSAGVVGCWYDGTDPCNLSVMQNLAQILRAAGLPVLEMVGITGSTVELANTADQELGRWAAELTRPRSSQSRKLAGAMLALPMTPEPTLEESVIFDILQRAWEKDLERRGVAGRHDWSVRSAINARKPNWVLPPQLTTVFL